MALNYITFDIDTLKRTKRDVCEELEMFALFYNNEDFKAFEKGEHYEESDRFEVYISNAGVDEVYEAVEYCMLSLRNSCSIRIYYTDFDGMEHQYVMNAKEINHRSEHRVWGEWEVI